MKLLKGIKLLICDDEKPTLELIESIIDWKALGITHILKALNGISALEIIKTSHPDILITDIIMPGMDGLELINCIRKENTFMQIIILSAFSEFEYAQKAIGYGVKGYLLKPLDEEKLEKMIKESITEITLHTSMIPIDDNISTIDKSRYIRKAKEYIYSNYNENINLDAICSFSGISKNYFCNLFKVETGLSIWDYLTKYRMEKAKEFIANSDMKNYEIAYKVGYENPSYFSKIFRKYTGISPSDFRSAEKNR